MKIVFLDVDGVLNSEEFVLRKVAKDGVENVHKNFPLSEFCPNLVTNLNKITDATNAKIVVSSTWRFRPNIVELLKEAGVEAEVIGITRDFGDNLRGVEIDCWINDNPVSGFVILDDDNDMLPEQFPNFVQTSFKTGLDSTCVERAIKILNND